jgi:Fe-S cluster biogenesis protein NfuA
VEKLADRWLQSFDAILAIPATAGKPAISHRPANRSPVVPFGIGVAGNSSRRATKEVAPMDLRIRIENVLTRLRPYLQADGGDIELLDVMGSKARVRLTGKCAGCPSAHMTLYVGVEMAIKEEIAEFEELIVE